MASKKIIDLTNIADIDDNDLFIIETKEGTSSVSYSKLKEFINKNTIPSSDLGYGYYAPNLSLSLRNLTAGGLTAYKLYTTDSVTTKKIGLQDLIFDSYKKSIDKEGWYRFYVGHPYNSIFASLSRVGASGEIYSLLINGCNTKHVTITQLAGTKSTKQLITKVRVGAFEGDIYIDFYTTGKETVDRSHYEIVDNEGEETEECVEDIREVPNTYSVYGFGHTTTFPFIANEDYKRKGFKVPEYVEEYEMVKVSELIGGEIVTKEVERPVYNLILAEMELSEGFKTNGDILVTDTDGTTISLREIKRHLGL